MKLIQEKLSRSAWMAEKSREKTSYEKLSGSRWRAEKSREKTGYEQRGF